MPSTSTRSLSIPELRDTFDGRVTAPGDPGYDRARKVFYGKWDRRPAAVVRPGSAAEVAKDGFEALMAGKDHVVAGSMKNKMQAVSGRMMPDPMKAKAQSKLTEPGSGE